MSSLYDLIAPLITALDNKFNYVRGAVFGAGTATWIKKAGIPTGSDGVDGNYCINTLTNVAYKRTAGVWNVVSVGLTAKLSAIDALTWAADKLIVLTGTNTVSSISVSTFIQGILGNTTASSFLNAITPSQTGNNGKVLQSDGTNISWQAAGSSSPLTTKGDLYTFSTVNARLPVGTNNQYLTADSTQVNGIKWITPPFISANQTITLSGDATGSGSTAISVTLGTVAINKGGTGQTTAANALTALLPSQTGNNGKFLLSNGTTASWADMSVGDAELNAIAGLTSSADRVPYFTGTGTAALAVFTSTGRSIVAASTISAARTVLDLNTDTITMGCITVLQDGALIYAMPVAKAFSLPLSLAGTKVNNTVLPNATVVLSVQKNNSEIGTITISILGVATFTTFNTSFVVGDSLAIYGPAVKDPTWIGQVSFLVNLT